MSDKIRYSHLQAITVARDLVSLMESACERIQIAGSLRREKPEVGDIEILFIPKMVEVKDGLFDTKLVDAAADRIEAMVTWGHIHQRYNKAGLITWGEKNKLAVHSATEIPVDFFSTDRARWFVSLVIRTGPKELNIRLITEAAKRKIKVHAYGVLENLRTGEQITPASEEEVFMWCGVPYLKPEDRRS